MQSNNNSQWIKTYFIIFLAFVATLLVFFRQFQQVKDGYLQEKRVFYFHEFNSLIESYSDRAKMVFRFILENTSVAELMYKADSVSEKSETELAVIRESLKNHISGIYKTLQDHSFRQLHFHLKNNHSFLRMHRPEKFGDDLTGIRTTVELANKLKSSIQGFEEGRVLNGYRFVFPVSYKEKHVGTVETSINLNSVGNVWKTLGYREYALVLNKEAVIDKIFASEAVNYIQCPINPNKLIDKAVVSANFLQMMEKASSWIQTKMFSSDEVFAEFGLSDNRYLIVAIPLKNIQGERVATFVVLEPDKHYVELKSKFRLEIIFLCILFLVILLFARIHLKDKEKIEEMLSFLPICSSCHKIRPVESDPYNQDSWLALEEYFKRYQNMDFSHGICPKCAKDAYGMDVEDLKEKE